jgi:hypothetical protein
MKYTLEVKEDDDNNLYIELPDELLKQVGWEINDSLTWTDNKDGSFTLSKKNTKWVLVETISTFRHRYVVEVPENKIDWASDTVVCNDAKEFSQKHLDETIVSSRYVSYDEAMKMVKEDNAYASDFSEENLVKNFFTSMEDYEK